MNQCEFKDLNILFHIHFINGGYEIVQLYNNNKNEIHHVFLDG